MALTPIYTSPDVYLQRMIDRVRALGSRITDFSEGSAARTLYETLALALSTQSAVLDQLRSDSYLATATGDALDRKANDYRVLRKAGLAATGTVTISRAAAGAAVTIPAGWSELQVLPAPGQPQVAVITTADAVFAGSDTSKTVAAQAVEVGSNGNLAAGTVLLPVNPVSGFQTQGGFAAATTFAGGVDPESDDELRARVPLEVQARVKGRRTSLMAAALGVSGVTSANVLQAGDSRGSGGGSVPAGAVEVYYEGASALQPTVALAVADATLLNQTVSTLQATLLRLVCNVTVYCAAGVDTTQLAADVEAVIRATINAVPIGQVVRASTVIQAIHTVEDVVSIALPLTDLRKSTDTGGTSGDVTPKPIEYPDLAAADCTVTVTTL